MNLYKISTEYQNLLDNTFDVETGEINESSLAKLDQIADDLKNKGIAVASYIKNLEAEQKAIEQAKNSMASREKMLLNKINRLNEYLHSNMKRCGITEISSPYFDAKIKNCPPSVSITDESLISAVYKKIKIETSIDKNKIKQDIKSGITVDGATLINNTYLDIN